MGDWSFAGGIKANPELYSRYDVLERLGEGTYGEVFKGKRRLDGVIVALKETRDPQCATREGEALLALNHPNVVKLIEYFVQGANLILVLEFMPSDLFRIIDESDGRIPEAHVKGWMLQLLRGVAACHQASILHRDLKPSNLLVGADGSVKIGDFGQARVVPMQSADLLGINDTIFERDEAEMTQNMEKEEIDAWISGTTVAKSSVKESTETRAGSSQGLQEAAVNATGHVAGQCFCVTNDKGEVPERWDGMSGAGDSGGCRSLNCSMVKREGLIVAWSNHFVEMEETMETVKSAHDEELGRREWVLAEKNMVNAGHEKDGDFFYKLRSFLKRKGGRKPQKHFRVHIPQPAQHHWGRDRNDTERSEMIMEEGGRLDYTYQELDTKVLQESTHDIISGHRSSPISVMISTRGKSGMWLDSTLSKEIEVVKSDVELMDNVGLRPLVGNETSEEGTVFSGLAGPGSCVLEKSSKRSTSEPKESQSAYVNEPRIENPFDETYRTQMFGDSGRMITIGSHGGRDDTGSESKRRKAYELEKCAEEIMSADHVLEMGLETGDIGCKVDDDATMDMEANKHLSELQAVRNRILYGKQRRTDPEKRESPSLQSGNSIDSTSDFETSRGTPLVMTNSVVPPVEKDVLPKSKESVVEGEETEKAVRVLGLERVYNGIEGYRREVECAEEGTAACSSEKEGTIRFWDGDRQRWESPYVSDEDTGIEDRFDSERFGGGSAYSGKAGNGLFFDDGSCPVDEAPGYYAFGDSEVEECEQEEGDMTCQTRWYGPPDVRDSYVKGKLEVHEESSERGDVDEYSREIFGQFNDERFRVSEVPSQHETESTYSSESGNNGSNMSPFVGTRWYKAPELLYGATKYGKGLDMWAVGCIFAELLSGKPLFPGITDIDQLSRIVRMLGAPNENIWPGVSSLPDFDKISFSDERDLLSFGKLIPQASSSAVKFLEKFLVYDPEQRISAEAALKDVYFLEDPLPVVGHELKMPSFRRDSSASEDWGEWRDPGSPFSDFEILDSAPS